MLPGQPLGDQSVYIIMTCVYVCFLNYIGCLKTRPLPNWHVCSAHFMVFLCWDIS